MKAEEKTIMGALSNPEIDYYTIPRFQRPYSWNKDNAHVEQLWDDLYESFDEYKRSLLTLDGERTDTSYFLGPLVFVKNNRTRSYDIIDGQQRITTLHILLWCIYHKIEDEVERNRLASILLFYNKDPKLKVAVGDASTFLSIRENVDIARSSNMADCAKFFREKIASEDTDQILNFWKYLMSSVIFVVIETDDYLSSWGLFIGLNGKGEPLNPTDLIKAQVCGRAEEGEDASNIWDDKILPLKSNSTFYLLMLTRYKLSKAISENALFREFSRNFPNIIRTVDIATFSDVFYSFWDEPIENLKKNYKLTGNAVKHLRLIRDIDRRDHTPLLFKFAESFSLKDIFLEDFLRPLTVFQLRMAVARKRGREKKIISTFKDIQFTNKPDALREMISFYKSETIGDDDFKDLVSKLGYGDKACRLILRVYEEGERGGRTIREFDLEHLMPQAPTEFWYSAAGTRTKEEYDRLIENIGNIFPIDNSTNIEIGNDDYHIKKNAYQTYLADWSLARTTKTLDAWTHGSINARAQEIAKWAKDRWCF